MINFVLRVLQSLFALALLSLQTTSLSIPNSKLLVCIYLILGFTGLLDAAEGTKMVQARLDSTQRELKVISAIKFMINYLKNRKNKLVLVFILNNLIILSTLTLASSNFKVEVTLDLFAAIVWTNSVVLIASFLTKFFVALSKIRLILTIQTCSVFIQLIFQVLLNLFYPGSIFLYLLNYSSASIIAIFLAFLYVRNLKPVSYSNENSDITQTRLERELKSSIKLQSIQFLQASYLLLIPVIAIRVLDDADFISFGLLFKIFLTFVTALSTRLVMIWIEGTTEKDSREKTHRTLLSLLQDLKHCRLSTLASLILIFALSLLWNPVFKFPVIDSPFFWLNFIIFVNLQMVVWRRYYSLMADKSYLRILLGAMVQNVTLLLCFVIQSSFSSFNIFLIVNMPLICCYLILLDGFGSSSKHLASR